MSVRIIYFKLNFRISFFICGPDSTLYIDYKIVMGETICANDQLCVLKSARLQVASLGLVEFNGFEQRLEVAGSKTLIMANV